MKKSLLIVVSVAMLLVLLAGCGSQASSLVTVTGKISGGNVNLSEADFNNHATTETYHDPWVGSSGSDVAEKGILLKDLITMVKPSSDVSTIALICTDGKEYDVKFADAQNYDIMLVHWVAGTAIDQKSGGPVKVAYPKAAPYTNDQWAWWVVKVQFK